MAAGDEVVFLERRPDEAGRTVLVRHRPDGSLQDLVDGDTSVRTLVHEYGGGAVTVVGADDVVFSRLDDQRVWRRRGDGPPVPLTPVPPEPRTLRYADGCPHPLLPLVYMVRERHEPDGGVHNEVVAVDLDGSLAVQVVASGSDFVSAPRVSPDGSRLVWLAWDHPQMSWDGTELRAVDLDAKGRPVAGTVVVVAGGTEESVQQPRFGPDGTLHFVSDRTGWWNLYRSVGGDTAAMCPLEAEFGEPEWTFGTSTYQVRADGSVVTAWSRDGRSRLGVVAGDGSLSEISTPFTHLDSLSLVHDDLLAALAGSPTAPLAVVLVDLTTGDHRTRPVQHRRRTRPRLGVGGRARRLPHQRGPHRPRLLLPAPEPRGGRAAWGTTAARGDEPWRSHVRHRRRLPAEDPVLHLPRASPSST